MKFLIIGGDRRQMEIANFLNSKNHGIKTYGLPEICGIDSCIDLTNEVYQSDALILPLPLTKDGITVNIPLRDYTLKISDIIQLKPKFVFGGIIPKAIEEKLISAKIDYYDYYNSEKLTLKNAVLTAEAAISIAIKNTFNSIYGSQSLVIGYGRIGKQLAKYLKMLGSKVTATSRNEDTLVNIEIDGFNASKTEDILNDVGKFDYIFNTVPAPILNGEFFAGCKSNVFVEDLATNSGISLNEAKKFSISADVYGGLPGKYSPITAAKFIAAEILNKCRNIKF